MPIAEVNGLELYYEEHGGGEAEPLLCVMGLAGDASSWGSQVPVWSRRRRTIVFDSRDVGRSSYVETEYSILDLADDTVGLADRLGLDRFHLVGMSMGGAVAQEVALAWPDRVRSVALLVSYPVADAWMRERARVEEARLPHLSEEQALDEMTLVTIGAATHAQPRRLRYLRRLILSAPHRQRRDGYLRQLRASVTHDALDRLAGLSPPCLVVGAEQDLMVPVWHSRTLAQAIPGARLVVLGACGHSLHLEQADEVSTLVDDFLASAEAEAA